MHQHATSVKQPERRTTKKGRMKFAEHSPTTADDGDRSEPADADVLQLFFS
jgi:hypothetical protein